MRVVYKYSLTFANPSIHVQMPKGAEIVSVDIQHEVICLWALVDPLLETERRTFRIHGTGHKDIEPNERHVGSTLQFGGDLVWHVFEVTS